MDKILISNLEFHAHTGVTEDERSIGQRYAVDLELSTDLKKPGETDDFRDAVDYAALCEAVVEFGSNNTYALAEAMAAAIASTILDKFPAVDEVMVRAKKLHPPVPEIKDYFGVEIRRKRK